MAEFERINDEYGLDESPSETKKRLLPHYHGDIVRYLFLTSAILLILNLPVSKGPSLPLPLAIICMVILVISAGFTNRLKKAVVATDFIISVVGFFIAETYSVHIYKTTPFDGKDFFTYLAISVLLFFATYFSIRSIVRLFSAKSPS